MWKEIPGCNGLYFANELGQIKSADIPVDFIARNRRIKYIKKGRILKPVKNSHGYFCVSIYTNGKHKAVNIHRLVALTFIPNPEIKPQINHIDGNKENNVVSNLEWVTARENLLHAFRTGLNPGGRPWAGKFGALHCNSKAVIMCSMDGEEIKEYESVSLARKEHGSHVSDCLNGRRKSCGGYKWKYKSL